MAIIDETRSYTPLPLSNTVTNEQLINYLIDELDRISQTIDLLNEQIQYLNQQIILISP